MHAVKGSYIIKFFLQKQNGVSVVGSPSKRTKKKYMVVAHTQTVHLDKGQIRFTPNSVQPKPTGESQDCRLPAHTAVTVEFATRQQHVKEAGMLETDIIWPHSNILTRID